MKKFVSILLVAALLFSFVGCAKEEDVIGAWEREVTYLESYGCDCTMYILFAPNGGYVELLFATHTDELLNLEVGTWQLNGNKIEAVEDGQPGTTVYKVGRNTLKNGDNKYTQTDRADEVFQILSSVL